MTTERAQRLLDKLIAIHGDPEAAHILEDSMYFEFAYSIAHEEIDTLEKAREIAKIILKSKGLDFPRWHA